MTCRHLLPPPSELLPAVLAASTDLVVVADCDGTVAEINHVAGRLLGTTTRSLLDLVHAEDRDALLELLAAFELSVGALAPVPFPLQLVGADGRWIELEVVGAEPVARGGTTWIVLVLRDVRARAVTLGLLDRATTAGPVARGGSLPDGRDLLDRQRLAADIERGLAENEFDLHYQPIRDVRSGRIAGFEGLVRWNHPTRGLLPAADFLPVAEGTSLIEDIGEVVLRQGCRQLARWQRRFDGSPPMLALNVSACQLLRGDFADRVERELDRSGADVGGLCIELTETHSLDREQRAVSELQRLRDMGATVALDDFGTGYSSLHQLQEIGADVMKIDRAFISRLGLDRGATAIVRAAVELGRAFGMVTVAEGVTSVEQHRELLMIGCDRVQGFLVAPALPVELAEEMLAAEPADTPAVGLVDAAQRLDVLRAYDRLADIDVEYEPSEEEVAAIAGVTALEARRGMTFDTARDAAELPRFGAAAIS